MIERLSAPDGAAGAIERDPRTVSQSGGRLSRSPRAVEPRFSVTTGTRAWAPSDSTELWATADVMIVGRTRRYIRVTGEPPGQ